MLNSASINDFNVNMDYFVQMFCSRKATRRNKTEHTYSKVITVKCVEHITDLNYPSRLSQNCNKFEVIVSLRKSGLPVLPPRKNRRM